MPESRRERRDLEDRPAERAIEVMVRRYQSGVINEATDEVAVEEPFEIRVANQPVSLIMRTPGDDRSLSAGFLFAEGIIQSADDILSVEFAPDQDGFPQENVLNYRLRPNLEASTALWTRNFPTTASCGLCGKASIDAARVNLAPISDRSDIPEPVLGTLDAKLRSAQAIFSRTGGLHAAGLFDLEGNLVAVHEDVGRHNAVDKVVGERLLGRHLPLSGSILLVSGRASFELIQKAARAGIPIFAAIGAPSSLAVELAESVGIMLIGLLRPGRFVVYSHPERMTDCPGGSSQAETGASAHCPASSSGVE